MTAALDLSRADVGLALLAAIAVQGALVGALRLGAAARSAPLAAAEPAPLAISVVPELIEAPLLKLGGRRDPTRLPDLAAVPRPVERVAAPTPARPLAAPSPQAPHAAIAAPSPADAGAAPSDAALARVADPSPAQLAPAAPANVDTPGEADGVRHGTESDPLKAHAVGLYRAQLDAWFSARFPIRGALPFDELGKLRASVIVRVGPSRNVVGFSIVAPSGNAVFDQRLRGALAALEGSGAELPPPPPLYPDVLGQSLRLQFSCTQRARCE